MAEHESQVAIAIPAYNESGLCGFIADADRAFAEAGVQPVFVVIDECSTIDSTRRAEAP